MSRPAMAGPLPPAPSQNLARFWAALAAVLALALFLPAQVPAGGTATPRVECQAAAGVTYALYLPQGYSPDRRWPALIGFDPGGNGMNVVRAFRAAADRYGWILVGSNDFRNGEWKTVLPGIEAVWNEVVKRYPVDARRIYSTGMSGGARVAAALGWVQRERLAGVVACAAGLPEGMRLAPGEYRSAFLGVVGDTDFNYLEMKRLDEVFQGQRVPYRRMVFPGPHGWPPPEVLGRAVEWLELTAMREGRQSVDAGLVQGWCERDMAEARGAERQGDPLEACRLWEGIARDYRGLVEKLPAEAEADRLAARPDFGELLQRRRRADERESKDQARALAVFQTVWADENRLPDFERWAGDLRVKEYQKRIQSPACPEPEKLAGRRVLGALATACLQHGQDTSVPWGPRQVLLWRLAALILPGNPAVRYNLACAWASTGQRAEALQALAEAVRLGLADRDLVRGDPQLAPLRGDPGFEKVLASMPERPAP